MKIGDIVMGNSIIHKSYWGRIGIITEVSKHLDEPRYRVWWPDGRKHWHGPTRLEKLNENR